MASDDTVQQRGRDRPESTQLEDTLLRPELEERSPVDREEEARILEKASVLLEPRFSPSRVIGKGGMGIVLEARQVGLGRDVAVKLLGEQFRNDPVAAKRFSIEGRASAALKHPNVVEIYDIDEASGFIVMELIHGESLRGRINRIGQLPPAEVRRIGRELLDALATAHAQGIVHRDVKPSNILIDRAGTLKLVDFGVAYLGDLGLTRAGGYVGTPAYMPPEQLRGQTVDGRADIYAAGATLFEAATGSKLHTDTGSIADVARVILETSGDRALASTLSRAVAMRVEERFPTASAFRDALAIEHEARASLLEISPTAAIGSIDPPKRPSRARAFGIAVALLLAFACAISAALLIEKNTMVSAPPDVPLERDHAKLAMLPFKDSTGVPDLDFARAGLPVLLRSALAGVPGLSIIGYYQLEARLLKRDAPREAWIDAAKQLGADFVVDGALEKKGDEIEVSVVLHRLESEHGESQARWDGLVVPIQDVPEAVRKTAKLIAEQALGHSIALQGARAEFEAQRMLLTGIAELERHRLPEAIRDLEAARDLDPTSSEVHYDLAVATWWQGRRAEEIKLHIRRALELAQGTPGSASSVFLRGLELLVDHRWFEAIGYFKDAAARFPDDRDILYGLSEAFFNAGFARDGVLTYKEVVTRHPSFTLGANHALTYALVQDDKEILDWVIKDVISKDPTMIAGPIRALVMKRDHGSAIDRLEEISEKMQSAPPDDVSASDVRGLLIEEYAVTGHVDLALTLINAMSVDRTRSTRVHGWDGFAGPGPEDRPATFRLRLAALDHVLGSTKEAKKKEDECLADLKSLDVGAGPVDGLAQLLLLELGARDLEGIDRTFEALKAATPPELANDPRILAAQVFRALEHGRQKEISALDADHNPEIAAIIQAALASGRGDKEAAQLWIKAAKASGDGRFVLLERAHAAAELAKSHDDRGVIEECAEVIEPRYFQWSWGTLAGRCLLLTAEAAAHLGDKQVEAHALERFFELRSQPDEGDPLTSAAARLAKRPAAGP